MIARITGTVIEHDEKSVVVEVNNIGYTVYTPALPPLESIATFHTHLVIREDAEELYGFLQKEEKNLFRILIGVSGVGPKTALQMMTLYTLPDLVRIIKNSDAKSISLVSGIGKKTAEKIVIDLKDKLDVFSTSAQSPESDLVEALLSLGYKEYQIRGVVGAIDQTLPLQKQITEALQKIQK